MFIIFIGPPGAGKGTQTRRLTRHLNIPHISTGAMLRDARKDENVLARQVAELLDQGRLLPDELVVKIVQRRLEADDCRQGCLFDGFPRTLAQARALEQLLQARGQQIDRALEMRVPEAELVQRMLARAKLEGRSDDTPETIKRRFHVYQAETVPLLSFYERRHLLKTIDAVGEQDEVFDRILAALPARTNQAVSP